MRLETAGPNSGSAATLRVIMPLNKRTNNVLSSEDKVVFNPNGAAAAVQDVIDKRANIAFFVQQADVNNLLFKQINDAKLKIIPILSREIIRQQVGGQNIYTVKENIEVRGGGLFGKDSTVTTSCTPVTYFTGKAEAYNIVGSDLDDHDDMVKAIQSANATDLIPADGPWAKFLKGAKSLSATALETTLKASESAAGAISETIKGN
jgi:hypothetical protein